MFGPIPKFTIMSLPRLCRLCVNICTDSKSLYDENGRVTELYEITLKYFHPRILNMEEWTHLTALCLHCWRHICEFQDFQWSILAAQTKLGEDDVGGIAVKTEVEEFPEESRDSDLVHFAESPISKSKEAEFKEPVLEVFSGNSAATDEKRFIALPELQLVDVHEDSSDNDSAADTDDTSRYGIGQAGGSLATGDGTTSAGYAEYFSDFKITEVTSDADGKAPEKFAYKCLYRRRTLDKHLAKLMPNIKCVVCSESWSKYSLLREHFRRSHPQEKLYIVCCKRKLGTQFQIEEHLRLHNNPNAYKCDLCDKKPFTLKSSLKRHMAKRHPNALKPKVYICKECGKGFDLKKELWRHYHVRHPLCEQLLPECPANEEPCSSGAGDRAVPIADEYECADDADVNSTAYCSQADTTVAAIGDTGDPLLADDNDLSSDDSEEQRVAVAKSEGKRKKKMEKLNELVTKWMPIITCALCPQSYTKLQQLQAHFHDSHPTENFYMTCCNRKLPGPYQIEEHFHFHNDPQAFKCLICNMSFTIKSSLSRHMTVQHHEGSRDKCKKCGKRFGGKGALTMHKKICRRDVVHRT